MSQSFVDISKVLTGESSLDGTLATDYESRIGTYHESTLQKMIAAYDAAVLGGKTAEEAVEFTLTDATPELDGHHRIARIILSAWFTGQFGTPFEDVEPPKLVENYSQSLLWKVIGAHAPGYTNAGYGVWSAPPPGF